MDNSSRFGKRLEGPVSCDAIEAALGDDWNLGRVAGGNPGARASVLSLVVYVADPGAVGGVFDTLDELSHLQPSRTIVLLPDLPDAPEGQTVWYSTQMLPSAGSDQWISSERVVIAAQGHAIRHLAPLADQLILADLPVALWWVGDFLPQHDALSERLAELAERLIVDSGDFRAPNVSFARANWIGRQRHLACAVSDLNWTRLTPWRELVAQFFSAPAARKFESRIDRVTVHYAGHRLGESQYLLLLGWLASRLDWHLEEAGRFTRSDGRSIAVKLERDLSEDRIGLRQVRLAVGEAANFLVARQDDDLHALTEVALADSTPLRRIVRFETADRSVLLGSELMFFGHDWIFEAALASAVAQLRAGRPSLPGRR